MTNEEAATELLRVATTRMTFPEREACEAIRDGQTINPEQARLMDQLKTEFAADLARARPIEFCRETPDEEGGGLL